ncbi:hypothetical protein ACWEOO_32475 [Kribbella sp. NPDC004138]
MIATRLSGVTTDRLAQTPQRRPGRGGQQRAAEEDAAEQTHRAVEFGQRGDLVELGLGRSHRDADDEGRTVGRSEPLADRAPGGNLLLDRGRYRVPALVEGRGVPLVMPSEDDRVPGGCPGSGQHGRHVRARALEPSLHEDRVGEALVLDDALALGQQVPAGQQVRADREDRGHQESHQGEGRDEPVPQAERTTSAPHCGSSR